MTAAELIARINAGQIIETVDPATGEHFYKWRTPDTPVKDTPVGIDRVAMK
jgi:hypothetical protein